MSFIARNYSTEEAGHHSCFSLYEDRGADQHKEHQSTSSELPAEIPDSQSESYLPDLPGEIPDSQPDPVYQTNSPFRDPDYTGVFSQWPSGDTSDIHLSDAKSFDTVDYNLRNEGSSSPIDLSLANKENIDPLANQFDGVRRQVVNDSDYDESADSPSASGTQIIPGGTHLKDRIVSLHHYSPFPALCFG